MGLASAPLFEGITECDCKRMMDCFGARSEKYKAGEVMLTYGEGGNEIGILTSGSGAIERVDFEGTRYLLEMLSQGDAFGETIAFCDPLGDSFMAVAKEESEAVFIDKEKVYRQCSNACECHAAFVSNMLEVISRKAMRLSERIEVISSRSIRDKLMRYFLMLASRQGSRKVTLPFSFTELADYICADRSAMMRELKKMKDENIVELSRRTVLIV